MIESLQGVVNADQPLDHVSTGGQPAAHHLEGLAAAGCRMVVDLRDPREPRGLDEQTVVERLGMRYVNLPVHPGTMTDDTLDTMRDTVKGLQGDRAFVHCGSGNRVGAALIPYLILDLGYDEDTAVTAAMRMGLQSAELLEWGRDYIRRKSRETGETG